MTSIVFDTILQDGMKKGIIPAKSKDARVWYREQAEAVTSVNETNLLSSAGDRLTSKLLPGRMYIYKYDPKHKKTLPYYDTVPLIFPYKIWNDGFMALNLHYLPLNLRAKLMDGLYDFTNNRRYDETTRLVLSYKLLNSISRLRYFKPCIKQYLFSHVRTRFLNVKSTEWDVALFLPLARFKKQSINKVYADSRAIIQ